MTNLLEAMKYVGIVIASGIGLLVIILLLRIAVYSCVRGLGDGIIDTFLRLEPKNGEEKEKKEESK